MRADFPFFPSFDERGDRLAGDVRLLAGLAERGACTAAKDVSMAGLLGSLAMLLEPTGSGVTIDLADIPTPDGVDLDEWLVCFPCLVFLVSGPPGQEGAVAAAAAERGLTYATLGTIDGSGVLTRARGRDHRRRDRPPCRGRHPPAAGRRPADGLRSMAIGWCSTPT